MENKATIIAVAGKGGVGKTSLSATIVRCLVEKYPDKKILAIDADPAVGLSTALGIDVKLTIDDIRKEIIASVDEKDTRTAIELLGEAKYRIFDALVETDGYSFIAVGRPETAGCYCKINSYLKEVISILSNEFDYVVIDGEAGIEQINRRVMEKVTHLLLITDPSKKGCQVINTIKSVADELVMYEKIGVIVNRMADESLKDYINTNGIPVLSYIEDDKNLSVFDIKGENIFNLPAESNVVNGVKQSKGRPTLGFLPYGTVNDVCRTLNVPKKLDKAIDVILRGETIKYDIMQEDDNYMVYTFAGGMFVSTSFKTSTTFKRLFGKIAYFITGAKQLFSMRTLPLTVHIDGQRHHGRYIMMMVLNSASAAGFRINKARDIDDGLIDVILVERKRSYLVALFTLLKMFLFGLNSVKKHKNVVIQKCKEVKIENHSNEPFTQDGEEADFLTKEIKITSPITVFYGLNSKKPKKV